MTAFKKLVFAVPFLLCFAATLYFLGPVLESSVFNIAISALINLLIFLAAFSLMCFFFVLFATLADRWEIILPAGAVASILPLFFLKSPGNIILVVGSLASFLLTSAVLKNKLKTYLDFRPFSLFLSPTKTLSSLLILVIGFIYFVNINKEISEKGFTIPDILVNTALKIASPDQAELGSGAVDESVLPSDTKEQLESIKANRGELEKLGISTKIIDSLEKASEKSQGSGQNLVKNVALDQFNSIIEPYKRYIPFVLSILFLISLQSIFSLFTIFFGPLYWLTFFVLEKSKFITFTKEMREVKKLVVS